MLIENNEVATHLYRIAQEATNNSIKHGQPRSIEIGLFATGGRVRLTVRDDGRGFKLKPKAREGMGLRTMSYRADSIGADFAFYPIEPCGTEVVCRLRNPIK